MQPGVYEPIMTFTRSGAPEPEPWPHRQLPSTAQHNEEDLDKMGRSLCRTVKEFRITLTLFCLVESTTTSLEMGVGGLVLPTADEDFTPSLGKLGPRLVSPRSNYYTIAG